MGEVPAIAIMLETGDIYKQVCKKKAPLSKKTAGKFGFALDTRAVNG